LSEDISFSISSGGFSIIISLFGITPRLLLLEEELVFGNFFSVENTGFSLLFDDGMVVSNVGFEVSSSVGEGFSLGG